ncbi:uncharacterized protein si:dkey-12j5.1 isoform X2 [Brienomyrus brachyistius]|uniref:uncharacterized protein si:dkey-12j5.1 isoform X2 n=1 Tax=Brienomyrus brachyistius TaxID=42636 RepID=UPI0020B22509|nr:uncharacterized protein si:dkey-12j5.1 isoform X2 [Brienomyrus brachyistius]
MGGQAKKKKKNRSSRRERPPHDSRLTVQERVKLKMQDKAKKKTAERYTAEQLLEKTQECMDNFDFEMARLFCQRALDIEPTNLNTLDMFGNICAELGDVEKAKQVFLRAVELSPDEGHSKYMYLGQMHTGKEAIQHFSKGIEIMLKELEKQARPAPPVAAAAAAVNRNPEVTAKDMSVAFCSVAEIYFTDLCMEEGAADRCRDTIDKALQYDPENPEGLQLMASYLFSVDKPQEGKEFLMRSVGVWLPRHHQEAESAEGEEHQQNAMPPYESRITTAKLLVEATEYEVWYLLGWTSYLQSEKPEETETFKDSARTYLTKARKLYVKLRCDDAALLEHVDQLLGELQPSVEEEGSEDEDLPLDDIGDDFVQSSDEETAMEH